MSLRASAKTENPFGFLSSLSVMLVVAALLCPSMLMPSAVRAKARSAVNNTPAPVSAPAEPFILGAASSLGGSLTVREGLITGLISFLREPFLGLLPASMPDAFAAAKPPTMTEKLASSLLGFFIAGTKKGNAGLTEPLPPLPPPPPYPNIKYDFDGDGKADVGRWHSENTELKVKKSGSSGYLTYTVGISSAKAAPGDYDGDGDTDAGTFYSGTWKYKTTVGGSETSETWGTSGDIPVPGNYDGNAQTDYAVFRPSDNTWRVKKRPSGTESTTSFGSSGDIPVPGDYDGDGVTDYALFRPGNATWYIQKSTGGSITQQWGLSIDIPLQGDFDGDGKSDMAVYRPSTGVWYALESGGTYPDAIQQTWGNYGDQPAPADYDGDGRTDFCVWRPTTGVWYTYLNDPSSEESQYLTETLGVPGDTAVPSAYTKQIAGTATGNEIAAARLNPKNATGGTNLYSQNFGWGTSLVGLPGRSGLNAGFGMSYNSLVWTKIGSAMYFDADISNITPGFRFGFPEIEPVYYDTEKSLWAYMMVTPGGGRTQFRQTAASATFETADSSYTQLVTNNGSNPNAPVEDTTITVKTTDGTQMSYVWNMGAYRCTKIIDRNGNYITIAYTEGLLTTVTDTLGRVITVNYDTGGQPTTITQTWKTNNGEGSGTTTHTWASFSYTTWEVDINFGNLAVIGPPDSTVVKVLDKITYADTSWTKFHYNGYLQVKQIDNHADDDHKLNHVRTNLASVSGEQSECPRFTQTKTYAENFNSGTEVTSNNSAPASDTFTGPNGSETTKSVKMYMASHPDDLYSLVHFGPSGYKEGLTLASEDCLGTDYECAIRKRWSWSNFTQDNTGVSYITNPRVIESRVGDGTNTKKTAISYYSSGGAYPYGLPEIVTVGDTTTVLKTQKTIYNLSSNYTSRRIIGLPSESYLWEGTDSGTLMSKVTYTYDGGSDSGLTSATQHDTTNYGTGLNYRGNLTTTTRCDASTSTTSTCTNSVSSSTAYNIAGSPVSQTDARGRVSTISYTDDWNDNPSPNRTTYAYPTTVTDPGGFSSTIEYRYDTGANVWARSPTPTGSGNTYGKKTSRTYNDTTGRIIKEMVINTGAYTEYEYAGTGNAMTSYTTIVDANNDTYINGSDEVATLTEFDGAGRVRRTRTENPNAPTGTHTGKLIEYNILGQLKRETVPAEISVSGDTWTLAGDDSAGWLWNEKQYDWKGRVKRTIPSDSNGSDGKDTLIEYDGCGCAGGQVTTIKGPQIIGYNAAGTLETTAKRRMQKAYEDILGRSYKTEVWDFAENSPSAPYSTTKTTFNGRDQATLIRQYAGADTSSTYQDTTMTYDGHGRVSTFRKPEYTSSTYVTTTYNPDDTPATVTDPRGAVTSYKYGQLDSHGTEDRALVTKIEYAPPSSNPSYPNVLHIPDVADVTFAYDNAGNRQTMTDGTGTLTYTYDELSRLKTEQKDFADKPENQPEGGYLLSHEYHLNGALKSITDPFNRVTTYSADKLGRTTAIGGAGDSILQGEDAYASEIKYRAFGAVKEMTMGTAAETEVTMTYDDALRPLSYGADNSTTATGNYVQKANYTYYNDGMENEIDSLRNGSTNNQFDRKNEYDFAGRLKKSTVGPSGSTHYEIMTYNAFNKLTGRTMQTYGLGELDYDVNNQYSTKSYDSAGNVVTATTSGPNLQGGSSWQTTTKNWWYDAAGRMAKFKEEGSYGPDMHVGGETFYDGDGRPAQHTELVKLNYPIGWGDWTPLDWYYIYSSVTGEKIVDIQSDGTPIGQRVYMGGTLIFDTSYQGPFALSNGTQPYTAIGFKVTDPVSGSTQEMESDGSVPLDISTSTNVGNPNARNEIAGLGTSIPSTAPQNPYTPNYPRGGYAGNADSGFQIDGMPVSYDSFMASARSSGLLFAGNHIVSETWRPKHVFSHPPGVNGPTESWAKETYLGSYREHVRWNMIELPGGGAEYDATFDTTKIDKRPRRKQKNVTTVDSLKLKTAISFCAQQMFGVELVGEFKWSGAGSNGTMNFQVMNGGTVPSLRDNNTVENVSTFAVNNVTTSFTYLSTGFSGAGFTWKPTGVYRGWHGIFGATGTFHKRRNFRVETNTNFTVSDINSPHFTPIGESTGLNNGLGHLKVYGNSDS